MRANLISESKSKFARKLLLNMKSKPPEIAFRNVKLNLEILSGLSDNGLVFFAGESKTDF